MSYWSSGPNYLPWGRKWLLSNLCFTPNSHRKALRLREILSLALAKTSPKSDPLQAPWFLWIPWVPDSWLHGLCSPGVSLTPQVPLILLLPPPQDSLNSTYCLALGETLHLLPSISGWSLSGHFADNSARFQSQNTLQTGQTVVWRLCDWAGVQISPCETCLVSEDSWSGLLGTFLLEPDTGQNLHLALTHMQSWPNTIFQPKQLTAAWADGLYFQLA